MCGGDSARQNTRDIKCGGNGIYDIGCGVGVMGGPGCEDDA